MLGGAAIQQGYRVIYGEARTLPEEIADASLDGTRKDLLADLATVPLLIVDDLDLRKLPHTATGGCSNSLCGATSERPTS